MFRMYPYVFYLCPICRFPEIGLPLAKSSKFWRMFSIFTHHLRGYPFIFETLHFYLPHVGCSVISRWDFPMDSPPPVTQTDELHDALERVTEQLESSVRGPGNLAWPREGEIWMVYIIGGYPTMGGLEGTNS